MNTGRALLALGLLLLAGCNDSALPYLPGSDPTRDSGVRDLSEARGPADMTFVQQRFATPIQLAPVDDISTLVTGDFNGDGRRDIVYCSGPNRNRMIRPLFGNGDGTFAPGASVSLPCDWTHFDGFDFDKDGRWDVFTGEMLARGNKDGTFTLKKLSYGGVVADANGDGNIDLVDYVSVGGGRPNVHYFTYANGDFQDGGEAFAVQAAPNNRVCTGPLGHSGRGSFACWVSGITAYLPAKGSPGRPLGVGEVGVPFNQLSLTRAFDSDLDGQPDGFGLVMWSFGATYKGSDDTFGSDLPLSAGPQATLAVADLNGDGLMDVVATSQADNQVVILYRTLDRKNVAQKLAFNRPVTGNAVGLADFDGDGKIDIAVAVTGGAQLAGVLLFRGL